MSRRRGRKLMGEINVVPYIDVMLVLLIIFMVTAPMLSQGIKVDLPRAAAEPIAPDDLEPLLLSVDSEGTMYLNLGDPRQALDEKACSKWPAPPCAGNPSAPYWSRLTGPCHMGAWWRAWCCCSRRAQRRSVSSRNRCQPGTEPGRADQWLSLRAVICGPGSARPSSMGWPWLRSRSRPFNGARIHRRRSLRSRATLSVTRTCHRRCRRVRPCASPHPSYP